MCLQQAAGNGKKIVPFISFRFVLGSRQTYHDQRRKTKRNAKKMEEAVAAWPKPKLQIL